MKVKYSRFRHNAKQTSFTSPTGPRRQGGEHEHVQYPTNDDVTSGWSCRRPENISILSSLLGSKGLVLELTVEDIATWASETLAVEFRVPIKWRVLKR